MHRDMAWRKPDASLPKRAASLLVGLLILLPGSGFAQSLLCKRYQAEYAALERSLAAEAFQTRQSAAERQGLNRLIDRYQALGCQEANLLFGARAECVHLSQRIGLIQARSQTQGIDHERRMALLTRIERHCGPLPSAPPAIPIESNTRGRNPFFERFEDQGSITVLPDEAPGVSLDERHRRSLSPQKVACVRLCDGYFFPLPSGQAGPDGADGVCQALCPAATTKAFRYTGSGIETAVDEDGNRYSSLANAGKYRKSIDNACGCKRPGESWSRVLKPAEAITGQSNDEATPEPIKADQETKPKQAQSQEARQPAPQGPQGPSPSVTPALPFDPGETREIVNPDGSRRIVRQVGPRPSADR
jgi:hypothetical protein